MMTETKEKRLLILGGSGGLSSVIAKDALNRGYSVWTVTRGQRPLPEGVIPIIVDRNDLAGLDAALQSKGVYWDAAIDCICMNKTQARSDIELLSKHTKRLLAISTDSVYDPYHKKTPQTEEGVFIEEGGEDSQVSYGCNKRRMEVEFLKDMNSENHTLDITLFRPGHIYGPGFLLGCFPENSRQKDLPGLIQAERPVKLVGLGTYLIHPIYVDDLARVVVDCIENEKTFNQIYCIGGPEAVENRYYYECIANALGKSLAVEEVPLKGYLEAHPEYSGHLCHRIYDLTKLKEAGVTLPATHIEEGIRKHLRALGYQN